MSSKSNKKKIAAILSNKTRSVKVVKSQFGDFSFTLKRVDGYQKLISITRSRSEENVSDNEAGLKFLIENLKASVIGWDGVKFRDVQDSYEVKELIKENGEELANELLDEYVDFDKDLLGMFLSERLDVANELIIAVSQTIMNEQEEAEETKKV